MSRLCKHKITNIGTYTTVFINLFYIINYFSHSYNPIKCKNVKTTISYLAQKYFGQKVLWSESFKGKIDFGQKKKLVKKILFIKNSRPKNFVKKKL